ncbi:hypothetical protein D8S78_22940 [Natrialba swarupiae]|nr:hypothetical protein [Natrialba swarupiae]
MASWTDDQLHVETTLGNITQAQEELGDFLEIDHDSVEITVPPTPSSASAADRFKVHLRTGCSVAFRTYWSARPSRVPT